MGALFLLAIFLLAIVYISRHNKEKGPAHSAKSEDAPERKDGLDTQNLPSHLSQEARTHYLKIAAFSGKRYITHADARAYMAHSIWSELNAMPGWCAWDISVHEADGQYERMERGITSKDITILCYDPKYQLAKVQGKTGIYLTSCNRCSCPDFRKRHIPCKHMYAVGIWLEGDVKKQLMDTQHKSLYGLNLVLVGHLPKSSKGEGGIRASIESLGGAWTEAIDIDVSAAVVGTEPSAARVDRLKRFDIECLTPESLNEIFRIQGEFHYALPTSDSAT